MAIYALGDLVPTIDPDAYVHPDAVVIGNVTLAAGSSVWPQVVLRGDYGRIEIGERTNVQDGSVLHCTPMDPTIIQLIFMASYLYSSHIKRLVNCAIDSPLEEAWQAEFDHVLSQLNLSEQGGNAVLEPFLNRQKT